MTKKTKYAVIAITAAICLVALPFLAILPFAASNAVVALYSVVFERRPTESEIVGKYVYTAEWGRAVLELRADKTFIETVSTAGQQPTQISGSWSSESGDAGVSADISFKPFIGVDDFSRGRQFGVAGLNFYKQRLGSVYGEIDPDTGVRFLKQ
jgi:hypothetical protein